MAKTVDIDFDAMKDWILETYDLIFDWLKNFFATIDTYESIAVGVIGIGLILLIVGFVLL